MPVQRHRRDTQRGSDFRQGRTGQAVAVGEGDRGGDDALGVEFGRAAEAGAAVFTLAAFGPGAAPEHRGEVGIPQR